MIEVVNTDHGGTETCASRRLLGSGGDAEIARSCPHARHQVFFFMPFMQLARNVWRGLPWRPFASACLEHSIEAALRGVSGAFTFGVGLVAAGALVPGGVVGVV